MVTNPYTPEFFERESADSKIGARAILPLLIERYRPRVLVDVGCGVGAWVDEAERLGVSAVGIDGPWVPSRFGRVYTWDLSRPIPPHVFSVIPADLAICLELAEHLPPLRGPGLVAELCQLAPVVLWSAATPGQRGEGHVNEQPERYWVREFAKHGRRPDHWIRREIEGREELPIWYRRNVVVFA